MQWRVRCAGGRVQSIVRVRVGIGGKMPGKLNENRILARLSAADIALLDPHLAPVDFQAGEELEACRRPIKYVCFPEFGIISVVADGSGGQDIEVGIIGREGMTGLAIVMGTDLSPQRSFVHVEGVGSSARKTLSLRCRTAEPCIGDCFDTPTHS